MGFSCGIIGLPNVGKSTVFNALSGAGAAMANYPFCTIDANRGVVPVADPRLAHVGEILAKPNPIPTRLEFVDIAGLVRGASKGEGLGNTFLGHIRNVDAVAHVVRCFADPDVSHIEGGIDPIRDIEIINTELMLADLDVLGRAREKAEPHARSGDKRARAEVEDIDRMTAALNQGQSLGTLERTAEGARYGTITDKPVVYVANVGEGESDGSCVETISDFARSHNAAFLSLSGHVEEEVSELSSDEKAQYLQALGLRESGLVRLTRTVYSLLDLVTFYTVTTDLQAWTVPDGTRAPQAAGRIHTDFEHGFIRAEVFHYDDLVEAGSEHAIRDAGHLRSEGKDYLVADGDVIHFLFNV